MAEQDPAPRPGQTDAKDDVMDLGKSTCIEGTGPTNGGGGTGVASSDNTGVGCHQDSAQNKSSSCDSEPKDAVFWPVQEGGWGNCDGDEGSRGWRENGNGEPYVGGRMRKRSVSSAVLDFEELGLTPPPEVDDQAMADAADGLFFDDYETELADKQLFGQIIGRTPSGSFDAAFNSDLDADDFHCSVSVDDNDDERGHAFEMHGSKDSSARTHEGSAVTVAAMLPEEEITMTPLSVEARRRMSRSLSDACGFDPVPFTVLGESHDSLTSSTSRGNGVQRTKMALPLRVLKKGSLWVPGVQNAGNTCFISALLQATASCSRMQRYVGVNSLPTGYAAKQLEAAASILTGPNRYSSSSSVVAAAAAAKQQGGPKGYIFKESAVVKRLRAVLANLDVVRAESVPAPIDIRSLQSHVISLWPKYRHGDQQDADELLYVLLEAVDKQVLEAARCDARDRIWESLFEASRSSPTQRWVRSSAKRVVQVAPNPLQGTVMSQMACRSCGTFFALRGTPYRVLPLALLPSPASRLALNSLDQCLRNFCSQEVLDGVECAGPCNLQRRQMYRRCSLGKLPPTLCIHLGRRHFDIATGRIIKLGHHVQFPLELDLTPYSFYQTEIIDPILLGNYGVALDGRKPFERKHANSSRSPDVYILQAIIIHHGGAEGGHFTAMRRLDGHDWVHISDSQVRRISEEQVLLSQAYMLFYDRPEPISVALCVDV